MCSKVPIDEFQYPRALFWFCPATCSICPAVSWIVSLVLRLVVRSWGLSEAFWIVVGYYLLSRVRGSLREEASNSPILDLDCSLSSFLFALPPELIFGLPFCSSGTKTLTPSLSEKAATSTTSLSVESPSASLSSLSFWPPIREPTPLADGSFSSYARDCGSDSAAMGRLFCGSLVSLTLRLSPIGPAVKIEAMGFPLSDWGLWAGDFSWAQLPRSFSWASPPSSELIELSGASGPSVGFSEPLRLETLVLSSTWRSLSPICALSTAWARPSWLLEFPCMSRNNAFRGRTSLESSPRPLFARPWAGPAPQSKGQREGSAGSWPVLHLIRQTRRGLVLCTHPLKARFELCSSAKECYKWRRPNSKGTVWCRRPLTQAIIEGDPARVQMSELARA